MKKVFVGMSGGVDSSVSALLLKEQGHNVTGVYMKNWSKDLPGMKCPWAEDLADAKRVAVKLGIDFEIWDFEDAYREKVVEYMLAEFKKGNTPNPDIMCNEEIKFKLFYEQAMTRGADFIATGHYARIGQARLNEDAGDLHFMDDGNGALNLRVEGMRTAAAEALAPVTCSDRMTGRDLDCKLSAPSGLDYKLPASSINPSPVLLRAVDENKDQTYFLYRISDEALRHTLFPIGEMLKPAVKKLAKEKGLHNAYKKESMGVCFVGEVGMKDFLKEYIDIAPGEIREADTEKVLGYHEGAIFYTIGQRHGLYLSGEKGSVSDGLPYYVVRKDLAKNIVYVSKNLNHSALWTRELTLKDVILRSIDTNTNEHSAKSILAGVQTAAAGALAPSAHGDRPDGRAQSKLNLAGCPVRVRLRHRAPLIPASFDGKALKFETEIKRPASGQSAVLYDGEICLGGGIIA